VEDIWKEDIPRNLAGEEVSHGAGFVLNYETCLNRLPEELRPVRPGRSPDLADEQVACGRDGRVADAALMDERLRKAALGQVAEHRSGEPIRIELRRAIQHVGRGRFVVLWPRQLILGCECP
jgi:hypothetical protein